MEPVYGHGQCRQTARSMAHHGIAIIRLVSCESAPGKRMTPHDKDTLIIPLSCIFVNITAYGSPLLDIVTKSGHYNTYVIVPPCHQGG